MLEYIYSIKDLIMKYSILALDLDGTLTNSEKRITPKTLESVQKAADTGVDIVLASGRPVLGIKDIAKQLQLYDKGGYILAYNGAEIINCKTGNLVLKKELPMECYPLICSAARKYGVNALTYDDEGILAESDDAKYVIKEAINNNISIKKVEVLEDVVKAAVPKFMIVGEPEDLKKVKDELDKQIGDIISIFFSEPYFLELTPKNVKKDSSLECLVSHLGKTCDELMCIGDGLNDIPMFKVSGLAVAMENAYPETKQYADDVTLSNDDDGVAYAIEKYIFNNNAE